MPSARFAVVALSLLACRGSSSNDPTDTGTSTVTVTNPASRNACEDFVEGLCTTATRCNSDLTMEDCEADVRAQGLRCACAQSHDGPGLGTCLDILETIECDTFADEDVPDACDGLFAIRC